MDYYEISFTIKNAEPYQQDLLINELAELGFDTFEDIDNGFKAYIATSAYNKEELVQHLKPYQGMFSLEYEEQLIPQKNWNQEWESNFEPIEVGGEIFVRATFHQPQPKFRYEIVIDPKMAFGTGHHQTTSMMLEFILEDEFAGKKVLDMGCGTGILAIMASKKGADKIVAIDYDAVCYESTLENAILNGVPIIALCGSKEAIPDERYDSILANINRNILIDQMQRYSEVLKPGGEIYFSGFYEEPDLSIITEEAAKYSLKYHTHKKQQDWVAAKFVKKI